MHKQEKCYKTVRVKGDAESYVLGSTAVIMGDLPTHTHMVDVKKIVMKAVEDLELISSRDSIRKRISGYIHLYIKKLYIQLFLYKIKF